MNESPQRTEFTCHPIFSIFVEWFKHFLVHNKLTANVPVLFILDGHSTYRVYQDDQGKSCNCSVPPAVLQPQNSVCGCIVHVALEYFLRSGY